MPQGYIKEAAYQSLDIYIPGKWSKSWIHQRVIQVSSTESKRTLVVHEKSVGGLLYNGFPLKYTKEAAYQ